MKNGGNLWVYGFQKNSGSVVPAPGFGALHLGREVPFIVILRNLRGTALVR